MRAPLGMAMAGRIGLNRGRFFLMSWLMKLPIKLLIALAAILVLLLFTIQNPGKTVGLQLFGWPEKPYPAHFSVVVFVCFAVGLLVGVMMLSGKKGSSGGSGGSSKSK
jgi:uncharacterized integral membrane protein